MNQHESAGDAARRSTFSTLGVLLCALFVTPTAHADAPSRIGVDPHYTPAGFFDLHVCNWPNRPLFYLVVFSTERFAEIQSVAVSRPDGRPLQRMELNRFRVVQRKQKPDKRVFLEQFELPADAQDGWYSAQITLKNGEQYVAKDYVIHYKMELPAGLVPPHGAENIPVPSALAWNPVPGATYYKVWIKDIWDDGKQIFESKLLTKPRLDLPPDLIKPGGVYSWRVHARDVNENMLLGDFNHGTFTGENEFSTAN